MSAYKQDVIGDIATMRLSDAGRKFIEREELAHPVVGKHVDKSGRWIVYPDPVGLSTIGYGHLVKHGENFRNGLTQDEVEALFKIDLKQFEDCVNRAINRQMTQNQFDAMVSLAYNIGVGAFARSSVARYFNASNLDAAADAFLMWRNADGKPILLGRRRRESTLFETPDNSLPAFMEGKAC
jgi:lysozyme